MRCAYRLLYHDIPWTDMRNCGFADLCPAHRRWQASQQAGRPDRGQHGRAGNAGGARQRQIYGRGHVGTGLESLSVIDLPASMDSACSVPEAISA
jgi:hypothetical protein